MLQFFLRFIKKQIKASKCNRIIIFARKYLGDNIFASPTFFYPTLANPNVKLIIVGYNNAPKNIYANQITDNIECFVDYQGFFKTLFTLRKMGKVDAVFNLSKSSFKRWLLARLCKSNKTYDLFIKPSKQKAKVEGKTVYKYVYKQNAFLYFSQSLNKILNTNFTHKDICFKTDKYNSDKNKYIVICSGASGAYKVWNPKKFNELAIAISKLGYDVYLVSGTTEDDQKAAKQIFANKYFNGDTSFELLFSIFKSASLVVANDSGFMHLASLLKVATLCIFAHNTPEVYGYPFLDSFYSIVSNLKCHPCSHAKAQKLCPFNQKDLHLKCVESIELKDVLNKIVDIVKTYS
jgi:ADP-heptose:LPS heptosyltransferase